MMTAGFCAPARAMTVVALGDSTTAGSPGFDSPVMKPPRGQGNPESQYGYWLNKKFPDWGILNKGVSGERSDQILARFDKDVLAEKPGFLIVMAGVNDLYQGRDENFVMKNLEMIYRKASESKIPVLACSILPYNFMTPEVSARVQRVNAWIREYAREHGMLFCDTYRAAEAPDKPGKLAGTPDELHPDVETYRKIGEAIAMVFEENKIGKS